MLTLKDVVRDLHLSVHGSTEALERGVSGGYVGDVLSDVLAHGKAGSLWVTMQTHKNIVAVAVLKDLAGIIVVQGRQPSPEAIKKAGEERVVLMVSEAPAFETVGALSTLVAGGSS
jgi:hypothetical protein